MALVRRPDPTAALGRQAARDLVLWTTRDGREIPLDDMTDDHIANAIRVLSIWRARLRKREPGASILADLKSAIARFKRIERRRRKIAVAGRAGQSPSATRDRRPAWPRKPVAST